LGIRNDGVRRELARFWYALTDFVEGREKKQYSHFLFYWECKESGDYYEY